MVIIIKTDLNPKIMKFSIRSLSFLLFIFLSNTGFAQNLNLEELFDLRKKSSSDFKQYLNSRGWTATDNLPTDEKDFVGQKLDYHRLFNITTEVSIDHISSNDLQIKRISMLIPQKEVYSQYITKMISSSHRLIKSELENGDIIKVYQGKKNTFKVTTLTDKSNYSSSTKNRYRFLILSNEDYNLNF